MTFTLIQSAKANGTVPITKYKSTLTGLTLVLANVEGPVVNGYFCVATEAHDDDGLPHTLEHLVFLGSELYPYKGVLDMLANRCLASGTNAWTDVDHTCYTMTTAGKDGFLELLPIYLDHVLYPTLTDAGFTTEVHHISESGDDSGIVYSEMQGRENTGESRTHLLLLRLAYPNCGYSSETGGIMENLRTSTTVEKVRNYHNQFYRPENLTIIIAGQVSIEEVSRVLEPFETRILTKPPREPFVRPWQTPVPPLEASKNEKILYPSDEEDTGIVAVAWRGPKSTEENLKLTACSILLRYLSDTSVSPLQREFIEIADPYASQISFNIIENSESLLYFLFENVPLPKLDDIFAKLQQVLENIANGTEKIDMVRMGNILDRSILEYVNNLESNPHDAVAFMVIGDILYGSKPEDFEMRLNVNKLLEFLQTVDHSYWIDLLKEYIIDSKYVVVRAAPSIDEQHRMAKAEAIRIEEQRKQLGIKGLQQKGTKLTQATEDNTVPPPTEMIKSIPIPSVKCIHFHPMQIYRNGDEKLPVGFNLNKIPFFAEAYDIHTNFVYLIITMNTDPIPINLRRYLLLLLELITESPVRHGDTLMPYEEVVAALEKDTIQLGTHLGLESTSEFRCGPFSHTASLSLQVERKKFEKGIEWIVDLLHNTEFTVDRIRVIAAKMVNSISQLKRKGNSIAHDLLKTLYYADDSNVRLISILQQQKFLSEILEQLDKPEKSDKVIADLNELRQMIIVPSSMAAHVAADWKIMHEMDIDLNKPWAALAKSDAISSKSELTVISDYHKITPSHNVRQGTVVGLGCIESAFLYHAAPSIKSFNDPELADLLLFLQYLTQLEGPLWRQIRGQGLAYGYSLMPQPQEGLLYLTLYKCSNVVDAFRESKRIIEAQLKPDAVWQQTLLESAKSSLIFEIIEREKSIGNLVIQAILSSFKKVPIDYNHVLIQRVNDVNVNDLINVGKKYVKQLFSAEAKTAIVCPLDKANDIATAFVQMDRDLIVETTLENSILAQKCLA